MYTELFFPVYLNMIQIIQILFELFMGGMVDGGE